MEGKKVRKPHRKVCIRRTAIWGLLNAPFGLAPVLILWALTELPLKTETHNFAELGYRKLIDEGAIHFFFLAMIGAATVDLILARRKFVSDFAWIMIGLGTVAAVLIVFIYVAFLLGGDERHTFGQARWIFIITTVFTICFCTIAKYSLTLKEIEESKP